MILGIDQGTTGTTAVLLDPKGQFLGSFTSAVPQHFPEPGWVEHDPEEIWTSVEQAVVGVLQRTQRRASEISSIGITNQRETVSLFDGPKPLHRFIVWQDRRTADDCKKIKRFEKKIRSLSGLPVDPYFSASKIRYLKKILKLSSTNKSIRFRTIDGFLFRRLCKVDATEVTNASRTSLMNLKTLQWDQKLFSIFDIPRTWAPEIVPSEGLSFKTKDVIFLPDGIPVRAALGDQQAALFGQLGWTAGSGKITYGTGSFILLNTGPKPRITKNNLVSTVALQWRNKKVLYALEGSAFICGAWIQWLRDQLQMLRYSEESETLAHQAADSEGVMVIPALTGMGAPFWNADLKGMIVGLTRGSSRTHVARASLEALAFQNRALVDAMKKDSPGLKLNWKVDGGAVKNNLLMQIQADVLGSPLFRPRNLEATATGVALLAGFSEGILSLQEIERSWELDRKFEPRKENFKSLDENFKRWVKFIDSQQ